MPPVLAHPFRAANRTRTASRSSFAALTLAAVLALAGCGGSADATFNIGVQVAGEPTGVQIVPGSPQTVGIFAGQSIELDASEPVVWSLEVGGTAVVGSGTTVSYGGVDVTQTALTDSRIAVDTHADFALSGPVAITLVATSTFDSALVATITVVIG